MFLVGAGCKQIWQQGAAPSGPQEDTGTYAFFPPFSTGSCIWLHSQCAVP